MEIWIFYVTILSIINIIGFILYKQVQNDGILVVCYISITITILSLITLMYRYVNNESIIPKT
jgi:hypothetical protein